MYVHERINANGLVDVGGLLYLQGPAIHHSQSHPARCTHNTATYFLTKER